MSTKVQNPHLDLPDQKERKRGAQSILIEDPLLFPYAIQVKGVKFDVVKPFTIKSGKSMGQKINYIQTSCGKLSEAVLYIMKLRNALPENEGKLTVNETVSLEGFLKKTDKRAKEIGELLLKFDKLQKQ